MTGTGARRPWLVLSGCFLVSTGFNAYLLAPASLLPLLVREFAIDKPTAGLAISAAYLSWALLQLPGGLLLDRHDNRRLVYVAVVGFVVAAAAGAAVDSYPAFLATRLLAGATAVFIWTANANIVSRAFPADRRALATSVFVASAPVGLTIAQFAGPLVAAAWGWRAVLLVYPLVTVVGLPVFALALREPVRNESRLSLAGFARTLREPAILAVSLASAFAYALFLFLNSWMPTYATEVLAADLAAAGAAAALIPLSGVVARPGGGWLSDRLGRRRRPVVLLSFGLSLPVVGGLAAAGSLPAFAGALLLAGFASQLGIGVVYVYARELAGAGAGGTSLALVTAVSVVGSLLSPVAGGWVIESLSWTAGFGFAAALAVAGALAALAAPRA